MLLLVCLYYFAQFLTTNFRGGGDLGSGPAAEQIQFPGGGADPRSSPAAVEAAGVVADLGEDQGVGRSTASTSAAAIASLANLLSSYRAPGCLAEESK
ncbi:unnamed protein product [Urochloa humidicola]